MEKIPLQALSTKGNIAENWKHWLQRFEIYSTATDLDSKPEKIQCAQLLYCLGEEAIQIYNSFNISEEEINRIEVLKQKFTNYFRPKKNLTYERYKFFTTRQNNEKIEKFVTELKNQAKQCEFGNEKLMEDLIKTMVIIGIKDNAVREKLLENENTTLEKVVECCVITENSRRNLQYMKEKEAATNMSAREEEIDLVRRKKPQGGKYQNKEKRGEVNAHNRLGSKDFQIKNCRRCGFNHNINQCPAYGKKCSKCFVANHFAKVCKNKKYINNITADQNNDDTEMYIDSIESNNIKHCIVNLQVNNKVKVNLKFKLDTGASVNIILLEQLKLIEFSLRKIQRNTEILKTYTGDRISVLGKCFLNLQFKDKCLNNVEFYIVEGKNESILGLNSSIKLGVVTLHSDVKINSINAEQKLNDEYIDIIDEYKDIFKGIGKISKPYHIEIKDNAIPVVSPIRNVPFSLQNQFRTYLDDLIRLKIIKRVEESTEWVNSYVLVRKNDGSLRICLDPKNLNENIKTRKFKLPNINEITKNLNGSSVFSKLDATSGFWNVPLDQESSFLCTFGTPFGRFRFLRLPFGIRTASEVFQEYFKEIFNISNVEIYIDDILVHGKTKEEHDKSLKQVFEIARKNNIKFNLNKCKIGIPEIKYLGFKFSKQGMSIDEEMISAINDMPRPKDKKDIQKFLGLITHVGKFINNLSDITQPLRDLIKQDNIFDWSENQEHSFNKLKQLITRQPILKYFDPKELVTISVDASSVAVGAVLLQNNQPCAYASRALTDTQRRYAQIEKELLAICFGVEKFYQYVFGTKFVVETDHKPLISIFKKSLNTCPARLQRMLLSLQKYDIDLIYKPGKHLIIADTLSRLSVNKTLEDKMELEAHVCVIEKNVTISDVRLQQLINATNDDKELNLIRKYIHNGWPSHISKVPASIKQYYKLRTEITEGSNTLIYYGQRMIIPESWKQKILKNIHTGHLGIIKCIAKANASVFWLNINKDLEKFVNNCEVCNIHSNSNRKEPMKNHKIIKIPWQKVGIDIFELNGESFILVVDYYSKYPEIKNLNNDLTSKNVIQALKSIFSRHGIPQIVVSDNGRQFASTEFQMFSNTWNFKSVLVSPYHQQSNGLAERTIQSIKKLMKKCKEANEDIYLALLSFRNTPVYNSEYSPSQILMSRHLRDKLPINEQKLNPKIINRNKLQEIINNTQKHSKEQYDNRGVQSKSELKKDTLIWYQDKPKGIWKKGKIANRIRDRTYRIVRDDGTCIVRNRYYIKERQSNIAQVPTSQSSYVYFPSTSESACNSEHIPCSSNNQNVHIPMTTRHTNLKRNIKVPTKYDNYILYK